MAVEAGGGDLSEDSPRLVLAEHLPLAEVVIELPAGRVLHHQHHLLTVLKHCQRERGDTRQERQARKGKLKPS